MAVIIYILITVKNTAESTRFILDIIDKKATANNKGKLACVTAFFPQEIFEKMTRQRFLTVNNKEKTPT